ncbi:hypothetical protein BU17DRAFT_72722 [Hysterangium stoloniferum]|nr:hypothetical protein BU17DRAFT_72722 [Hysterangium stoloniferum]
MDLPEIELMAIGRRVFGQLHGYAPVVWGVCATERCLTLVRVMETLHAVFVCRTVYHYTILSYSNPLLVMSGVWYQAAVEKRFQLILCSLIQIFFSKMIYHTHGSLKPLFKTFVLSALRENVGGILISVFQFWKTPSKLRDMVYVMMVPLFTSRVVADCCTTVTLCIVLYRTRPRFKRFILTTIVVIVQTIILLAQPDTIWAMTIEFVTVHLYVNSFLASLNARNHLRKIDTPGEHISGTPQNIGKDAIGSRTINITGASESSLVAVHTVDLSRSSHPELEAKPQFEA